MRTSQRHARGKRILDKNALKNRGLGLGNLPIPLPALPNLPSPVAQILSQVIAGQSAPTPAPGGGTTGGSTGGTGSSGGGESSGGSGGSNGGGSSGGGSSGGGSNGGANSGGSSSGGSTGSSGGGNVGTGGTSGGAPAGGVQPNGNQATGSSGGGTSAGTTSGGSTSGGSTSGGSGGGGIASSGGSSAGGGAIAGSPGSGTGAIGTNSASSVVASTGGAGVNSNSQGPDHSSSSAGSNAQVDANAIESGAENQSRVVTSTISGHVATFTIPAAGSTGKPGTSGIPGTSGPGDNPAAGGSDSTKHGPSSGAIAAVVVVIILVSLASAAFFIRRRHTAKRTERRRRWFFGLNGSTTKLSFSPDQDSALATNGTRSARSSFATTVDRDALRISTPSFDLAPLMPGVPPMAEIRDNSSNPPVSVLVHVDEKRISGFSTHSSGSEADSQYLTIANTANDFHFAPEVHTPMSVRPFSPSESFAFPKPPGPQSGEWDSPKRNSSRPGTADTNSNRGSFSWLHRSLSPPPLVSTTTRSLVPSTPSRVKSFSELQVTPPIRRISLESSDPFADPLSGEGSELDGDFHERELILRPFIPTLEDELLVTPGDIVCVLRSYNDGWAFVEMLNPRGEGKQGLIPIDCMRHPSQALPAFLASKRVSSYHGGVTSAV